MPTIALTDPTPAIVTGGGRGLGRAIALALAELGCPVTVNYLSDRQSAERTCADIANAGGRAVAVAADVAEEAGVARVVEAARQAFGPTGILVNNAGIAIQRDVFELTAQDFDRIFRVNVRSAFLMTQAVLEEMRAAGYGRLVFLSSNASRTGGSMSAPYAGSKAAMEGLMHHYAQRLGRFGITANAIAPSIVETDIFAGKALPPTADMPLGRMGRPEEVAMVAQLIVACGYMTGQTLMVNAGRYMT